MQSLPSILSRFVRKELLIIFNFNTTGARVLDSIWASTPENLYSVFAKIKGTDQPAHPHSLISAFIILLLESIIYKLATNKLSIY